MIKNHLQTPWVIGYVESSNRHLTIDRDIGAYLKAKFLERIEEVRAKKVILDIDRFTVVVKDRVAYGYLKLRMRLSDRNGLAIRTIEVHRMAKLGIGEYREKLERLVIQMLDEAVDVMVKQYALFGL